MDENYLDSLLNEMSLDNEISKEMEEGNTQQDNYAASKAAAFENMVNQDSNTSLSSDDSIFGESQFDELDELDRMADMDMSDMDFSDLDFDDLDMLETSPRAAKQTNYSSAVSPEEAAFPSGGGELPPEGQEGLSIDDTFFEQPESRETTYTAASPEPQEAAFAAGAPEPQPAVSMPQEDMASPAFSDMNSSASPADMAQMAGMEAVAGPEAAMAGMEAAAPQTGGDIPADLEEGGVPQADDSADINDLLQSLGIQDEQSVDLEDAFTMLSGDGGMAAESVDSVAEAEADVPKKRKRSFAEFLFGSEEDDEPQMSDEELAAIKAEKKAARDAKKAEKKEISDAKKAEKASKNAEVNAKKAAQRAVKEANKKAMLESAPPEKKLNRTAVIVILAFFAMVGAVIILGTDTFNYQLVVKKASNYFDRQKYHMAYDEIAGVEVKDKDKELESKIYTVMYVERLYESYETNASLLRMDKALDSLLRGLVKYNEHYEEAQELNIVSDIDYSRSKIIAALQSVYNLTEQDAFAILALDSYAYREKLAEYAVDTENITISLKPEKPTADTSGPEAEDKAPSTEDSTQVLDASDVNIVDPDSDNGDTN